MAARKLDGPSGYPGRRAYLGPLAWIVALLASYWLLVDWQSVPTLISEALAAIH